MLIKCLGIISLREKGLQIKDIHKIWEIAEYINWEIPQRSFEMQITD